MNDHLEKIAKAIKENSDKPLNFRNFSFSQYFAAADPHTMFQQRQDDCMYTEKRPGNDN